MPKRVSLTRIASEITKAEGLKVKSTVAQTSEFLGILGERWRNMSSEEHAREVLCILTRAGLRSAHRKNDSVPDNVEQNT